MPNSFSALTFTDEVAAVQREMGSRPANQALLERGPEANILGPEETSFVAARDGFYMATVNSTGWPYIQFRGGPIGFLSVLNPTTLAFADVTGNRQYITTGNLRTDDRVALFFMDYPNQTRLKLLGHAEVIPWSEADTSKAGLLLDPKSRPERVIRIHLAAFSWNCPQHIPQRWTVEELKRTSIFDRITSLEQENQDLRARLENLTDAPASSTIVGRGTP